MKNAVISIMLTFLVTGCASYEPTTPIKKTEELRGLYGHLEKTDSGYEFTEYDTVKRSNWVSLGTSNPIWSTHKQRPCIGYGIVALSPGTMPEYDCMSSDQREKTFHSINHVDYFSFPGLVYGLVTLSTGGVGALLAVPSSEYFDVEAYQSAYTEAWVNSVENKGGVENLVQIKKELEAKYYAEEQRRKQKRKLRAEREKQDRENAVLAIRKSGIGTMVCREESMFTTIGYVEAFSNNKIKVSVQKRLGRNNTIVTIAGQSNVIWDDISNFYQCKTN